MQEEDERKTEEEEEWVIQVKQRVPGRRKEVFDYYTDFRGWPRWTGVSSVALDPPSSEDNPNGVGCVRSITSAGLITVRERVLSFEEPERFTYTIEKGMPMKDHLGEVLFEEIEGNDKPEENQGDKRPETWTLVTWRCKYTPSVWGTGWVTKTMAEHFFKSSLAKLAKVFEKGIEEGEKEVKQ